MRSIAQAGKRLRAFAVPPPTSLGAFATPKRRIRSLIRPRMRKRVSGGYRQQLRVLFK